MPEVCRPRIREDIDFSTTGLSPRKIRCTFTYMRGKNYVKTDKLWSQYSALAGDGRDKVCMERGTLQNLYDYAVEKMARVKNKTGSRTLPVLRSGPSGGRSFQDHARR
jgi:hypothetical protein